MSQKIILVFSFIFLIAFGVFIFLGSLRNWKIFINKPKKIDLIALFGDLGRIMYVIIGAFLTFFWILSLLGVLNIGPLAKIYK